MIPKVIHYCWFGGQPLPELAKKCIESWEKYCPDYEIVRWDETNFNVSMYHYTKEAYDNKKYAFVSDVARLYALVNYGGVYMDTDMELLKPIDELLECAAFTGFETVDQVAAGIIGCEKDNAILKELFNVYHDCRFIIDKGFDTTTIVARLTNICKKYGLRIDGKLQSVNGVIIYPSDYFYPKSWVTRQVILTDNTYGIHYYEGSWLNERIIYYNKVVDRLSVCLPYSISKYLAMALVGIKYDGISSTFKKVLKYFHCSILC